MPEYGFTINVSGNSVQEMKRIESELSRLGITARETGRSSAEALEPLSNKLSEIGTKIGEVFAIRELFHFGKEILNTTAEFEGFENRIKFASRNSYDAAENMSFLREEVTKLHMPLRQAYEGFSEMQAGLVGTGIEGDRLRSLFAGISTAAATLHLPEYSLQRTLLDFKEIGEIGLNRRIYRSLGTALPGIAGVIREAFGKSFDELEKSGISGSEFLSKIGPALEKHFSGGLANFGKSLQAKLVDMKNSALNTMLDLGNRLEPTFISILGGIQNAFSSAPVQFLVQHVNGLIAILGQSILVWGVYKGLVMGTAIAEGIYTVATKAMTVATLIAESATWSLSDAFGVLGISLAAVETAGFAIVLVGIIELLKSMEDELDGTIDKITNLKALTQQHDSFQKQYEESALAATSLGNMDLDEKSEFYSRLKGVTKAEDSKITESIRPQLDIAKRALAALKSSPASAYDSTMGIPKEQDPGYVERLQKQSDATDSLQTIADMSASQNAALKGIMDTVKKSPGFKELPGPPLTGGEPSKNGLHGSHLSGAEGGLNQARIVNLTIGEVMHVVTSDNKNLVGHAEQAAQYIARALDNISESRSGTQ